jgi:hypothetical protein
VGACSQLRGLEDTRAMHRYSHRARITGDTNSNARMPRGVPRNPHHQKQMRAPTPTPRTDAAASGEFNSVTTHLRNSDVCSRLQRPVCGRLGFAKPSMGEPTEFTRRSSVAATQRFGAGVRVCAENNEALGLRLGLYGPRDGVRGWVGVVGEFKNRINAGTRIQRDKPAYTSGVPGSNPPGQKRQPWSKANYGFSFVKGGSCS